jgi:hypothetical protein
MHGTCGAGLNAPLEIAFHQPEQGGDDVGQVVSAKSFPVYVVTLVASARSMRFILRTAGSCDRSAVPKMRSVTMT